ncbi:MAG: hypothetical protein PV358_08675, partial [Acidimicrobiales bacterium]|nr:hypothetical protein [Acidimicrobiales bacterium]
MDLTQLATPLYFGTMAIEHKVLARRAASRGPTAGDYTRPDTLASLTMGTVSLGLPLVTHRLVRAFAPGRGRWARGLVATTVAAAVATHTADDVEQAVVDAGGCAAALRTREAWSGHPHGAAVA